MHSLAAEHENKNIVVIGRNAFTVLLMRRGSQRGWIQMLITAVIDKDAKELLKRDEIKRHETADRIGLLCRFDSLPVETYEQFQREAFI